MIFRWIAILFVTSGLLGCQHEAKVAQTKCLPIVAVYPTWKIDKLPIADIPWQEFTHLAVIFALPQVDGSLHTTEVDALIPALVEAGHAQGKKIYVSIGGAHGYGDAFQQIAQDPLKLGKFVHQVRDYALKHQLDGIDIDWEYWTRQQLHNEGGNDPVESQLLVDLLAALRQALPEQIALTTSVFAGHWIGDQYLKEIQSHVNYVALMSYDFTGAWPSSDIAHHADYKTFKASTRYLLDRGFKRDKILVGLPFYGKEFVDGKKETIIDRDFSDILAHSEQQNRPINRGKLDDIYYETPQLVQQKAQYILNENFAGVMFFELTMDALASPHSLVKASNQVISPDFCAQK